MKPEVSVNSQRETRAFWAEQPEDEGPGSKPSLAPPGASGLAEPAPAAGGVFRPRVASLGRSSSDPSSVELTV